VKYSADARRDARAVDAVTTVALPMFALVGAGYAARRIHLLEAAAITGMNGFVYYFALPALLFVRVAAAPLRTLFDWRLMAAWLAGGLAVFALTVAVSAVVFGHRGATLGVRAFVATFGNIGYMGFPLVLTAFGRDATVPAVLIFVSDVFVIVSLAIAVIEAGLGRGGHWLAVARTIGNGLGRNPVILASGAGALLSLLALPLPAPVQAFGEFLGAAALPCALFALGASLVGRLVVSDVPAVAALVVAKLVVHPLAVWLLATHVFDLDALSMRVAVIEAALPTAVTVFVIAERYDVHVDQTSSAVLLSTLLSVLSVSSLLALLTAR
jgi:predicted permease